MSLVKSAVALGFLAWMPAVYAHGHLHHAWVGGWQNGKQIPDPPQWRWPPLYDERFVAHDKLQHPDIICNTGSTPAPSNFVVPAGERLDIMWKWPKDYSHPGCIMTYLARCNGPCKDVDKTKLEFIKFQESCIISEYGAKKRRWATDALIENQYPPAKNDPSPLDERYMLTLKMPSDLVDDEYVLRSELIALHFNDKQFYPNCISIKLEGGSGTSKPKGTLGTQLYSLQKDHCLTMKSVVDVPFDDNTFVNPGPPLYNGGGGSDSAVNGTGSTEGETGPSEGGNNSDDSTPSPSPTPSTSRSSTTSTTSTPSPTPTPPANGGSQNNGYNTKIPSETAEEDEDTTTDGTTNPPPPPPPAAVGNSGDKPVEQKNTQPTEGGVESRLDRFCREHGHRWRVARFCREWSQGNKDGRTDDRSRQY